MRHMNEISNFISTNVKCLFINYLSHIKDVHKGNHTWFR